MLRATSLVILLVAAGCDGVPSARTADVDAGVPTPPPPAPYTPVPSALGDALSAAGLDVTQLPPFDALDATARDAVMQSFARALGAGCDDCHDADRAAPTPRTRIARLMWDRFVRGLRLRGGGPLYCDSCHQGALTFLDHSDESIDGPIGQFMQASYVDALVRSDGAPHGCATCHGTPFVPGFLDDWGAGDGPDGGGGGDDVDGGVVGTVDAGAPPDLGVVGCEALLVCLDGCGHDDDSCERACKAAASDAARKLLDAARRCTLSDCEASKRCVDANDDTADCNACFSNSSSGGVTGVACMPADDPNCGDCADAWLACETN